MSPDVLTSSIGVSKASATEDGERRAVYNSLKVKPVEKKCTYSRRTGAIEFGKEAMKAAALVNGGAAVATLAFIGQIVGSNVDLSLARSLASS